MKPDDNFELPDDVATDHEVNMQTSPSVEAAKASDTVLQIKRKESWLKKHGPKPPSTGIRILDSVVALLIVTCVWLIIKAWIWAIFS